MSQSYTVRRRDRQNYDSYMYTALTFDGYYVNTDDNVFSCISHVRAALFFQRAKSVKRFFPDFILVLTSQMRAPEMKLFYFSIFSVLFHVV